jgi:multidrug efflux pump subunit AcrB
MAHATDDDLIQHKHNTARFFVEHRQIAWAALVAVVLWGFYGFFSMPQRKDPDLPVRVAVASCQWPGASAQQVEQLVTRQMEQTIAQNKTIQPPDPSHWGIRSLSLPGVSFIQVQLSEDTHDTTEQFSDINLKLNALNSRLPDGAGPIQFQSGFGDTAALMLTVASPPADKLEIEIRAQSIEKAIRAARKRNLHPPLEPVAIVYSFPLALSRTMLEQITEDFRQRAEAAGILEESSLVSGPGFLGLNGGSRYKDEQIAAFLRQYIDTRLQPSERDPDLWLPVIIRELETTTAKLSSAAASKYSYAQLDNYTDLIGRTLLGVPQTSRIDRTGVLPQQIYLNYSQDRLAAYGLQPSKLGDLLSTRNITLPGGQVQAGARNILLDPSAEFDSAAAIGNVMVGNSPQGAPMYLRDLVQISRGYKSPADFLNYYTWIDKDGQTHRSRAITIGVYMRSGEQIKAFGAAVDEKFRQLEGLLPRDLIIARTSDQPLQVEENISLFMRALVEAIILVVLIALVGFWEWRSALLMAISMPITLAMTFGLVHLVHVDLQQVSIATLIIALGLLVDDPVVANDAIKLELASGQSRLHSAWLGPTKLARAILYATVTNIIAYLPFLLLTGTTGDFLRSLPIVMTAALISSRLVSMTFIPLLGYVILRPAKRKEPTIEEKRERGFYGFYYRLSGLAIRHRWAVFALSLCFLVGGGLIATTLKSQFFPEDVQYWSYVDVWLPNGAPLSLTNETAQHAEGIIRQVADKYEKEVSSKDGKNAATPNLLKTLTTFVGGGGPRFWFSVSPEQKQPNYAQIVIQLNDKEATPELVKPLQEALSAEIPGAFLVVHQLQTNPVEFPVEIQLSGVSDVDPKDEAEDIRTLRHLAGQVQEILRLIPGVETVQNDWFAESPEVKLKVDVDRANLAGVTNRDVAASTAAATSGTVVTTFRQGNLQIPVVARLLPQERAQLSDVENLYVYASQGDQKIPLRSVSTIQNELTTERIRRQEHFRTIGVHAFVQAGILPSEVLAQAMPKLQEFQRNMPPGYRMIIGGEQAHQRSGFLNLAQVLLISILGIYGALLLQFGNAVKPLLVFAAVPYGVIGALVALAIMRTPFGFMAFLGVASLIGVIVSHVIVLFEFIEEMREKGEPLEQAVRDAGIQRLRPVLITVGATILALFPLAIEGGPLWQPLCYAQIGGLAVATFITLLLVPVLYSIAVLDLKIVSWEPREGETNASPLSTSETAPGFQ